VDAGIFLGGTIHDVAQVVGAGYSVSREAGDAATFVKLMRVAMLLPVIIAAVVITRMITAQSAERTSGVRPPFLPWFVVAFALLIAVNSAGVLPAPLLTLAVDISNWCLIAAIAAIGMKTQLAELSKVGIKPILLMVGETVFLASLVLALLRWGS
jgi:uncharacterized integral membrane protein (TIGR00698 family)